MILRYTIGASDYKRAMWIHMRPRRILAIPGIVLLVLMVAILIICCYRFFTTGEDFEYILALGAGLGYLCFWFFIYLPFRLRRIYRQLKVLHEEAVVEISDTQIKAKTSHSESNLPWEHFHKWKADKDLVVVYQSDVSFYLFPRRAFSSPEEFQTFQSILKTKLGPEKS
jgi:YcxB-like protein